MPAPGATPIIIYNSSTASQVPLAANLSQGELAINVTDKKLYSKDSGGNVILIASSGGDVTGPATATDNAIARFDTTTGKLIQNSVVTIADTTGNMAGVGTLTATTVNAALNGTLGATTPSTVAATTISASGNITGAQGATYGFIVPNSGAIRSGSNGKLQISADTGNAYADSNISFDIDGNVLATIDSSGNVGIGVTPSAWGSLFKVTQTLNSNYGSTGNDVYLGANYFYNSVGTWKYIANGYATQYYQDTGTHVWRTSASGLAGGTITFTQAMTLDASGGLQTLNTIGVGNATPSTSGAGITFPATQSASTDANTLDDYEEGTWTPAVTFATPGDLSVAYSYQIGQYQKVGGWVTISFSLRLSTFTFTTASGSLLVSGLPFTSYTETNGEFNGAGGFRGITKLNFTQISASAVSNVNTLQFNASGSSQVFTTVTSADTPTGGTLILKFTCSYKTA
jgi:hypothetical protein